MVLSLPGRVFVLLCEAGGKINYFMNSGLDVLAEYEKNNTLRAEYVYGLSGMIAKFDPDTGYLWYYKDHLGSTRHLGNTSMSVDYYPYGKEITQAGTGTNFKFIGKELDSGSNWYYVGSRYYDELMGRWVVPDKAGQYFSPYVYCGNNPVRLIDDNGYYGVDVHYDLIYFMALKVLGVSNDDAKSLSMSNLSVDENNLTRSENPNNWNNRLNLHFDSNLSNDIISKITNNPEELSIEQLGFDLHCVQDVLFAHKGYKAVYESIEGVPKGVLSLGHFPIREVENVTTRESGRTKLKKSTIEMIKYVYSIMNKYKKGKTEMSLAEILSISAGYVYKNNDFTDIQALAGGETRNSLNKRTDSIQQEWDTYWSPAVR